MLEKGKSIIKNKKKKIQWGTFKKVQIIEN